MVLIGDFALREYPDSTVDLICGRCFQTIAHGRKDSTFEEVRRNHKCEALRELHRRFARSRGTTHPLPARRARQ